MAIARLSFPLRFRRGETITTRLLVGHWPYYGIAIAGLILHQWLALPIYTWFDRFLAWIPLVIFLYVLRRYAKQPHKSIPILVLITLQVYVFFSLPQFTQDDLRLSRGIMYFPSEGSLTVAMLLTVGGELVFLAAFSLATFLSKKISVALYNPSYTPTISWARITKFYCVLAFLVYALAALTIGYLPVSVRYLATQLLNVYLGLSILLYLGYTYQRRRLIGLAYLLAIGMSFVGVIQGMLTAIVGPLVLLFLARWVWGRVFNVKWVILGILAILFINPVKNEFRSLPSWLNSDTSSFVSVEERLKDWSTSIERVWIEGSADDSVYASTASRTSDLLSFSQAIDQVPEIVPYNNGEGMDMAMLFWIPRVVWPSKGTSTDLIYDRYAITFGYLSEQEIGRTAVGISIFTEGYWNFGVPGVFIFLCVAGLLLGTFFGNNGRVGQVSTLVALAYVAPTVLILQALSVTIASLPSFLVGIYLVLRFFTLTSTMLSHVTLKLRGRTA